MPSTYIRVFEENGQHFGENSDGSLDTISETAFNVEKDLIENENLDTGILKTPALSEEELDIDFDSIDLSAFDDFATDVDSKEDEDLEGIDLSAFDDVVKKKDSTTDGLDLTTEELEIPTDTISTTEESAVKEELGNLESIGNTINNMGVQIAKFVPNFQLNQAVLLNKAFGDGWGDIAHLVITGGQDPSKIFLDEDEEETEGTSLQKARANSLRAINKLDSEMGEVKSLTNSIAQGDVGGTAAALVDAVGSLGSSAAVGVATFGVGIFSDMVANSIVDYNEVLAEENNKSIEDVFNDGEEEILVPSAIGLVAGSLEKIGLKGTGKAVKAAIKKAGTKNLKKFLGEPTKEGFTEWIQTGLETFNISLAEGKNEKESVASMWDMMASQDGLESFLKGAAGSGISVAGGAAIGKARRGRVSDLAIDKENKNKANELERNSDAIREELQKPNISPEVREALNQTLKENQVSLVNIFEQNKELNSRFTEEQKEQINTIGQVISSKQTILEDDNISTELIESTQGIIDGLENDIQNIINTARTQEPITKTQVEEETNLLDDEGNEVSMETILQAKEEIKEAVKNNVSLQDKIRIAEKYPEGIITVETGEISLHPNFENAVLSSFDFIDNKENLNSVIQRADKREQINEKDIDAAISEGLEAIDAVKRDTRLSKEERQEFEDLLFNELKKLENYDLTTETKTSTITETTEVRGIRKVTRTSAIQREESPTSPNQRIIGREVETDTKTKGTKTQVIEKGEKGDLILKEFDKDGITLNSTNLVDNDGNIITDVNQLEFVNSIKDNNDIVTGAVVRAGDVNITLNDAELGIDLASKQIESQIGDIDRGVFESFVSETERKFTVEEEVVKQREKNERDVRFSKKKDELKRKFAIEDSKRDDEVSQITDKMNQMDVKGGKLDITNQTTTNTIDIDDIKSRTDVDVIEADIKDFEGIPMFFTITDNLTTGNVVNPYTGNTIDNLKGGLGFPFTKGNTNNAWANTEDDTALETLKGAKKIFENNKTLFKKLWKEGRLPEGHVPMAVVRMGDDGIKSNEAIFRVLSDNIKSKIPKKNQKNAFKELKKDLEGIANGTTKEKPKAQYVLDYIKTNKVKELTQLLDNITDISIGNRVPIFDRLTSGNIKKDVDSAGKASKNAGIALLDGLDESSRELIHARFLFKILDEKSMSGVPAEHLVEMVGIDIREDSPSKTTHPNYPSGVKGVSLGILRQPVHMADMFGDARGIVAQKIVKFKPTEKIKEMSDRMALARGLAVGIGIPSNSLKGVTLKTKIEAVDELNGFFRQAFPNVQITNSQEAFDSVVSDESVRKYLRDGDVVYGLTQDGKIFLNPKLATTKTAFHEVGHIWMDYMKGKNKTLHSKGLDLVTGSKEYEQALEEYPDNDALAREEALVEIMATKGEKIADAAQRAKFKQWLATLWEFVQKELKSFKGIKKKDIGDLTIGEFTDGMLSDILSGEKLTTKELKADELTSKLNKFDISKLIDPKTIGKEFYVDAATKSFLKENPDQVENHKKIRSIMGTKWAKSQWKFSKKNTNKQAQDFLNEISSENFWEESGFELDVVAQEIASMGIDLEVAEDMVLKSYETWTNRILSTGKQTVESETTGLTSIERFKQGFVEFADSKQRQIAKLKDDFRNQLRTVKADKAAQDKIIRDFRKDISTFISKEMPSDAMITKGLLNQALTSNTKESLTKVAERIINLQESTLEAKEEQFRGEVISEIQQLSNPKVFKTKGKISKSAISQEQRRNILDFMRGFKGVEFESLSNQVLIDIQTRLRAMHGAGAEEIATSKAMRDSRVKEVSNRILSIVKDKLLNKGGAEFLNYKDAINLVERTRGDFILSMGKDEVYNRRNIEEFKDIYEGKSNVVGRFLNVKDRNQADISKSLVKSVKGFVQNSGNKDFLGFMTSLMTNEKSRIDFNENIIKPMNVSDYKQEQDSGRINSSQRKLKKKIFGSKFFKSANNKLSSDSGILLNREDGSLINNGILSNDEVIVMYNQLKIPIAHDKIKNLEINTDKINEIIDYVNSNPDLKAYAEGMIDMYSNELPSINDSLVEEGFPAIDEGEYLSRKEELDTVNVNDTDKIDAINEKNDILDRIYGKDKRPAVIPYTPSTVESNQEQSTENIFFDQKKMVSIISGNAISRRRGGVYVIRNNDIMLENYIDGMIRMKNKMSIYNDFKKYFSKDVVNIMRDKIGKKFGDDFEYSLMKSIAGKRNVDTFQMGSSSSVMNFLDKANGTVMFLNTSSALTQITSYMNYAFEHSNNPIAFTKILLSPAGVFVNKETREAAKRLASKGWVINRLKKNSSSLELSSANNNKKLSKNIKNIINTGYTPTRYMDIAAILAGGSQFWVETKKQQLKKYKADGLSDLEAITRAEADADLETFRASQEGQQSSLDSRTSRQQSSRNRFFLSFMTTPIQMNRIMVNSMKDLFNGRGNPINNLGKVVGIWGVQNLAYHAIANGFRHFYGEDEEIGENEETFSFANGVLDSALAGFGLYGVATILTKNLIYDGAVALSKSGGKGATEFQNEINQFLTMDDTKDSYTNPLLIILDNITRTNAPLRIKANNLKKTYHSLDKGDWVGYAEASANIAELILSVPTGKAFSVGRQFTDSMNLFVEDSLESTTRILRALNLVKEYQEGITVERRAKFDEAVELRRSEAQEEARKSKGTKKKVSDKRKRKLLLSIDELLDE